MKIRDKFGWPIETVKGRHLHNFMRRLIHCDLKQTLGRRNDDNILQSSEDACCAVKPDVPKVNMPPNADINWWVDEQMAQIDEDTIQGILALPDMQPLHFTSGMGIRNYYGLWRKNALTDYFNKELGIYHADDMSGILMEALWHRVHGKEYDPAPTIKRYADHWAKAGCNMKGEKI